MTPLISIVLPTYNGSKLIATSIQSCLDQTFREFELIIVNDCSTDNTPEIIDAFAKKDPRIRVVNNTTNKKLPLSLNTGFELAKGKYHTWTSDDNYYSPDALQTLYALIEGSPGTGFVYTDYQIVDESGKVTGKREFGDINEKFTHFQGCSACFLYKASLFHQLGGYNPAAFLIEDYDFFVRSFLESGVLYVNRSDLYYYRDHPSSLTAKYGIWVNDLAKLTIEKLMDRVEKKLPASQLKLVYRKFAVYHAIQKNNSRSYKTYLGKLGRISKFEVFKTVFYVGLKKTWDGFRISVGGFIKMIAVLFGRSRT